MLGALLLRGVAAVLLLAGPALAAVRRLGVGPSALASRLLTPLSYGSYRTTPSVKTRLVYYKLSWNWGPRQITGRVSRLEPARESRWLRIRAKRIGCRASSRTPKDGIV